MSDEVPQEKAAEASEETKDFSPGHQSKKRKVPWKPAAGFAAVAILFFAAGFMFPKGPASTTGLAIGQVMTGQEAGSKAIDYINKYLLQTGYTADLVNVNESNGLYAIEINITGSTGSTIYPSYVTKDGNLLFVSSVDISKPPATQTPTTQPASQNITKTNKPDIKMFVMAFCPYGQQAEAGLGPALAAIGLNNVVFEPHYVIYSNYQGGGPNYCFDNASQYCSMHGINEMREDIRQMVILKYWPDKWWAYVNKVDSQASVSTIETQWRDIATSVGLNPDQIQQKFDSDALTLLANEASLNAKYSVQGSPTIFINDVEYSGGRAPANFQSGICGAFNTPPAGCSTAINATASNTPAGACGTA